MCIPFRTFELAAREEALLARWDAMEYPQMAVTVCRLSCGLLSIATLTLPTTIRPSRETHTGYHIMKRLAYLAVAAKAKITTKVILPPQGIPQDFDDRLESDYEVESPDDTRAILPRPPFKMHSKYRLMKRLVRVASATKAKIANRILRSPKATPEEPDDDPAYNEQLDSLFFKLSQELRDMIYAHLTEPWAYMKQATVRFTLTGTVPTYCVRLMCKRIRDEYDNHAAWMAQHKHDMLKITFSDLGRKDTITRPRNIGRAMQSTNFVLNLRERRDDLFYDIFDHLDWITEFHDKSDHLQTMDLNLHIPDGEGRARSAERLLFRFYRFTELHKVRTVSIWTFREGSYDKPCRQKLLATWRRGVGLMLYDAQLRDRVIPKAEEIMCHIMYGPSGRRHADM